MATLETVNINDILGVNLINPMLIKKGVVANDIEPEPTEPKETTAEEFILPPVTDTRPVNPQINETVNINDILKTKPLVAPQGPDNSSFINIRKVIQEDFNNRKLIKEDILNSPKLMEVVRTSLEARFAPSVELKKAKRIVTRALGGAAGGFSKDYRNMSDEDVFETWQNYQRAFSAVQSTTTVNEMVYGYRASDDIKAKLASGYLLFNQMDNAFTGEGSWSEMGDALVDYTRFTVADPTTLLSFGLGKVFQQIVMKTGAKVLGYRALMSAALDTAIKQGATKISAKKAIGTAALKATPYATADALFAIGSDAMQQMQLINVGIQGDESKTFFENYNKTQGAFVGVGTLFVIPIMVAASASLKELRKGPLSKTFLAYKDFDESLLKLTPEKAAENLNVKVKGNIKLDYVDESFGLIKGETKDFLVWEKLKDESKKIISKSGEKYTDTEVTNSFFMYLFNGNGKGGKGYGQALVDAGYTSHDALVKLYGNQTAVLAQTLTFLQPKKVTQIIKKFESDTGYKLNFLTKDGKVPGSKATPETLKAHLTRQTSSAGSSLQLIQSLSRSVEGEAVNIIGLQLGRKVVGLNKKVFDPEAPMRNRYGLSIYKRMITSHLATTGANIKGFTALISLNTAADFATAAIDISQSAIAKLAGKPDAAIKYYTRAKGGVLGGIRRGFDVVSPDIPIEYANKILALKPEMAVKLFRDVTGDGGYRDALGDFNLDKIVYGPDGFKKIAGDVERATWKTVDAVTKGAQTITMVRLQDEITKRWAFGTNVNIGIMREYGMTPEVFFSKNKENWAAVEMSSDKFMELLERATFRTMRETASVNWSTLPANNAFRSAAKSIEGFTNRSLLGYVIPFGSFLNTTIATMGDLSGVNALRSLYGKATGKPVDFANPTTAEAFGKMAVGYTALAVGIHYAREDIKNNIPVNQRERGDGSIEDTQFDWPESTINVLSRIMAAGLGDSNNPLDFDRSKVSSDLYTELAKQLGGQSLRDLKDFEKSLWQVGQEVLDSDTIPEAAGKIIIPVLSKPIQGVTRPLDPINQVWGLVSDGNMNPDYRQGAKVQNQMLRYINNIAAEFGVGDDLPKRASPTKGLYIIPDISKQIMTRTVQNATLMEELMNAADMDTWKAIRFNGPPEIKNRMDAIAAPLFESISFKYLNKNKNYFSLPMEDKKVMLRDITEEVKKKVIETIEAGLPKSLNLVRVLSGKNKDKIENIMENLNIEGSLEDLLEEEDGLNTLMKIQTHLDNYDAIYKKTR